MTDELMDTGEQLTQLYADTSTLAAAMVAMSIGAFAGHQPDSRLWEKQASAALAGQIELALEANIALLALREMDVDGTGVSLSDAAERGRRAAAALPSDLLDIDF